MARTDMLDILYSKEKSPLEFNFDALWMPSLFNFITPEDEQRLYAIASSLRYAGNIEIKNKMIDEIMVNRGFKRFHAGTNRVVYTYLENSSFVVKIALDRVGLGDNVAEFKNMFLLKPFVSKMFEVSPTGVIATAERVEPILSRQEFEAVGEEIFDLLVNCIIGKYVVEDVGSKCFMNYGVRKGFGPVLLDYTYVYELDGARLNCNLVDKLTGFKCDGVIDYDSGFNHLECNKCGKRYFAKGLEKDIKNKILLVKKGKIDMRAQLFEGDDLVMDLGNDGETKVIKSNPKPIVNGRIGVIFDDEDEIENKSNTPNPIWDENDIRRNVYIDKEEREFIQNGVSDIIADTRSRIIKDESDKVDARIMKELEETGKDTDGDKPLPQVRSTFIPEAKEDTTDLSASNNFGLKDEDFEEPKVELDPIIDKYMEEYGDGLDDDHFERIGKKKNVRDEY